MPTYLNSGTSDVSLGSYIIAPNKTITTYDFFTDLPTGVTQTSVSPMWNPILISRVDTGNNNGTATVTMPTLVAGQGGGVIDVVFHCTAGSCSIKFNDVSFTPPLLLGASETITLRVTIGKVESILITFTAASSSLKTDVLAR
jgi:hypothetical protein